MVSVKTIFTIGHSTRSIEEFIQILHKNKIKQLVDIRSIPRSRHNPQYEQTALIKSLPDAGIQYSHSKGLGGLRSSTKDSPNMAWHNKSFRNYADYMQTDNFKFALKDLIELTSKAPTVIMCAEAVPWRCHRSLVGDSLIARNIKVQDIMSLTSTKEHSITPFAVIDGTDVTYPSTNEDDLTK